MGYNTPVIIKYPFWRMTAQNPTAVYVRINKGQTYVPDTLVRQSVVIDGDIGYTLGQITEAR